MTSTLKLVKSGFYAMVSAAMGHNQDYAILLLEDDPDDVLLMQQAFERNQLRNPIQVVPDGQEGIDYLEGVGKYADRAQFPIPSVIILDINMPRKTGMEFLEWLRGRPELRGIPTIIMSSSRQDPDVSRGYELGASSYFLKPNTFQELVKLAALIHDYWQEALKPRRP